MSRTSQVLTTLGFIGILAAIGSADALLTGDAIRQPAHVRATMGVPKAVGTDVAAVLESQGIATLEGAEADRGSLLKRVITAEGAVRTAVLLKDNDRIGLFASIESADVKEYFGAIKEALVRALSPAVQDLRDETVEQPEGPIYNILTFLDTSIDTERIVFIRIQDRLYEFHIATGKETEMNALIEALSR